MGGVAEWTMATVLKTVNPQGFVGSNPTPSAMFFVPETPALTLDDLFEESLKRFMLEDFQIRPSTTMEPSS